MILILLVFLFAALPLVLTTEFPHLVLVSVYAGLAHILALIWGALIIATIARRHRITEWRQSKSCHVYPHK